MAELLRMPEVAANATEAVLQGWPVPENTPFDAADTIATVETEKALVDVAAETSGVILKTLIQAGSEVEVGAPIAVLGAVGETVDDFAALLSTLGVGTPTPAPAAVRRGVPAAVALDRERTFASPLARKLARETDLDVAEITGTGPGGRIVRRDVEEAIAGRVVRPTTPAVVTEPTTRAAAVETVPYTAIPHSKVRQATASRLTESKRTVPHFYVRGAARMDAFLKLRAKLNDGGPVKVSVNDLVVKATARAHVLVPQANVVWTADAMRSFTSVDISVAISTERGLVTPVLRGVELMTVSTVAATVQDYVARAKNGQLRQGELEGGSLCVSNLGMYGTEGFAAIINPPQSAILAVGAAAQQPVVRRGKVGVATVMQVTLSVDHRAIDGALAARWMQTFVGLLESPVRILA